MSISTYGSRSSPCDSLSPLDDIARNQNRGTKMFDDVIGFLREENLIGDARSQLPSQQPKITSAKTETATDPKYATTIATAHVRKPSEPQLTCLKVQVNHEVATLTTNLTTLPPFTTLIQRTHRPSDLLLVRSNGLSTISTSDLRQRICDAGTATCATTIQIPQPKPDNYPKTPDTPSPLIAMGNKLSAFTGFPSDDTASPHTAVRNPSRQFSSNALFSKRVDSKSPLSSPLTGGIISVQERESSSPVIAVEKVNRDEDASYERDDAYASTESFETEYDKPEPPQRSAARNRPKNDNLQQPLQAHLRKSSETLKPENRNPCKSSKSESNLRQKPLPFIPAPSPLPEDSPHKYGLKDRAATPDVPKPEALNVAKVRRRSSGLEVFQEAQSLQSASSFLNGLSIARHQAEAAQRKRKSPKTHTAEAFEGKKSDHGRARGHNFKPSGFAYARPLAFAQISCYRNHACLILSRNKQAPVECAVCHIDDDQEHFSCSWCALRMCRFCRKEFVEKGDAGLKERIRSAELGESS